MKIKVAYICHYSSPDLRTKLPLRLSLSDKFVLAASRKPITTNVDQFAIWNENAINEMKSHCEQVEFHVIAPYPYLKKHLVEWSEDGISYHIFKDRSYLNSFFQRNVFKAIKLKHKKNRTAIKEILQSINPDVVHLVGAENPYYSLCALDISKNIPLIVQLQTLMIEPDFETKYPISHQQYVYRSNIERAVLERADFIGTKVKHFIEVVRDIKNNAKFMDITLAVAEPIIKEEDEKPQVVIYYAKDISKAADWAIEAFAFVHKNHPEVTLKIVGGYTPLYKQQLDERINQLGIMESVRFTGMLPTHEDVINEVRKSRYALLPIKADYVAGTIREAMSAGVPVVTNITPGTPALNKNRKSVLLSEAGDFESMADNICRLIEDDNLYTEIKENASVTISERPTNCEVVNHWAECYQNIVSGQYSRDSR